MFVLDFRHEFREHPSKLRLREVQVRVLLSSLRLEGLAFRVESLEGVIHDSCFSYSGLLLSVEC